MLKLNVYARIIPAYVQVPAPAVPLVEVETFSEQFQDAQSQGPETCYAPDLADTLPATQLDGDGSEKQKQPSEAHIVVEPVAKDTGAEREALLKNALPTPPGPVSPVAIQEPHDWKRSPDPIAHAEKLCEELTETQMNDLMSKYSSVASSKGDVGLIRPDQLDEASRMSFFETLEQMVLMNRKKLSMDKDVVNKPSPAPCQAANLKIVAREASTGGVPEAAQAPGAPESSTGGLPDPVGSVPECGGSGGTAVPEPLAAAPNAGSEALAVPAETAVASPHGAAGAAATAATPEGGSMQVVPHASQPKNRELELAGLQALMNAQKQREAAQLERAQLQPRVAVTAATEKLDWGTHKKEGMRLKGSWRTALKVSDSLT